MCISNCAWKQALQFEGVSTSFSLQFPLVCIRSSFIVWPSLSSNLLVPLFLAPLFIPYALRQDCFCTPQDCFCTPQVMVTSGPILLREGKNQTRSLTLANIMVLNTRLHDAAGRWSPLGWTCFNWISEWNEQICGISPYKQMAVKCSRPLFSYFVYMQVAYCVVALYAASHWWPLG